MLLEHTKLKLGYTSTGGPYYSTSLSVLKPVASGQLQSVLPLSISVSHTSRKWHVEKLVVQCFHVFIKTNRAPIKTYIDELLRWCILRSVTVPRRTLFRTYFNILQYNCIISLQIPKILTLHGLLFSLVCRWRLPVEISYVSQHLKVLGQLTTMGFKLLQQPMTMLHSVSFHRICAAM
jgi:hypothetical protein